ncbi:MAG: hypothetical protein KDE27_29350 [Planctomycetes bacterium]|nr:hypothetical protein [Planctomycetota bacterium]
MRTPALRWVPLLLLVACHGKSRAPAPVTPQPNPDPVELGDPLPDLTADELAAFERGRALFTKRFKPSEGLGPVYNATSCASCHSTPVIGGGAQLYRNFYVAVVDPGFGPSFQSPLPGLPSLVIPAFGTPGSEHKLDAARVSMWNPSTNPPLVVAQRNSIPVFGTGLFEFVSNTTILANADPEDADNDGISGRYNADGAGIGRFGLKAQSNNVEFFTRAPLMNQMGITSDPFRGTAGTVSLAPGLAPQGTGTPNAPTRDTDPVQDPEISPADLGDLIAFTRFLAPPAPTPFDDAASRGEVEFEALGCAKCHIPELPSSRGPVRAYTDLLLHDMGPALADHINFAMPQLPQGGPTPQSPIDNGSEWRTQPLWGVSKFAPYLHDGRAETLDDAIRIHGGEGQAARDAYVALPADRREDVLAFLRHL